MNGPSQRGCSFVGFSERRNIGIQEGSALGAVARGGASVAGCCSLIGKSAQYVSATDPTYDTSVGTIQFFLM
ncbi:hypothetical protein CERSUDRAFT_115633 [Gelatoporia subvermispora B]|uniref:Uncharacterized protein n=1 Tax=Ceriporiopsis subvermispora (strain B) TaxID=914234 RepID=M2QWS7_CERS8|nr:hypothetical protein CERSUDRAFT_115633 [Gelatoporia subvermispora B]